MRQRNGFSLVELMVLVGILGIVTALSIPNFSRYVRSNRLSTTADRLAADLSLARTLAVSNGRIYRLTATAEGYTITDPVSGQTIREREYEGEVALVGEALVNFFPWGMADAATLDLSSSVGTRRVTILPTGIVEVQ
jgi:type II secretion system protein H